MRRRESRTGFTLVELLVVIAIIGILVSLLLPAVNAARSSSFTASCQNNLKNIGLALTKHMGTYEYFPAGREERDWSWAVHLLPGLEQQGLFDRLDPHNQAFPRSSPNDLTRTRLEIFRCPADSTPDFIPSTPQSIARRGHGTSNYSAAYGSRIKISENNWQPGWVSQGREGSGIFMGHYHRRTRREDVKDGMSSTISIGECSYDQYSPDRPAALWAGLAYAWSSVVRGNRYDEEIYGQPIRINSANSTAFGSRHSGGANFLFCDGHVQFISENIQSNAIDATYQKLTDRNDGFLLNADEY